MPQRVRSTSLLDGNPNIPDTHEEIWPGLLIHPERLGL